MKWEYAESAEGTQRPRSGEGSFNAKGAKNSKGVMDAAEWLGEMESPGQNQPPPLSLRLCVSLCGLCVLLFPSSKLFATFAFNISWSNKRRRREEGRAAGVGDAGERRDPRARQARLAEHPLHFIA